MSKPIVPTVDADFVDFMNTRAPLWVTNRAQIGLTTAQNTAMTGAATNTDKAWSDLSDAKLALRKAYDAWKQTKAASRLIAQAQVNSIKSFAIVQTNPENVYTAANIPAPKTPTPNQKPGQCTEVKANLNTVSGNLKLTWKCDNPGTTTGTVYTVERRIGTSGAWTPLGLSSVKSFTDLTLPAAAVVQYQITATRSGLVGTSSGPVSVVFGHAGNGQTFIVSVGNEKNTKLAA